MVSNCREERLHGTAKHGDQRSPFQIDRDRICYCSAFRRLAQVTQVVSASEGSVFHNRLTHSLKVAQVGKRLAEKLIKDTSADNPDLLEECGGLDPDVVEASALAHDLGHPPFGHIAEQELNELARGEKLLDGFEGNAQTFRIITKLESNRSEYQGLDLTRATLNATLKYPWLCDKNETRKRAKKYSVYDIDKEEFYLVRPLLKEGQKDDRQTLEASIMDFADDVTYSVHDFEDFYLAGLIPLRVLLQDKEEFSKFIDKWKTNIHDEELKEEIINKQENFKMILEMYPLVNTADSFPQLKMLSSTIIQKYIHSVSITNTYGKHGYLSRPLKTEVELQFLQQVVRQYVIFNPRLTTQQHGQRQIIKKLFNFYLDAIKNKKVDSIPLRFLSTVFSDRLKNLDNHDCEKVRIAVDIVASFSELEAVTMYRRLIGVDQGSVMDYIM